MNNETQEWEFAGCGGTLITNCHVLTAAHCLTYPREDYTEAVLINAWRPFHNNTNGTISKPFHLSRILPHLTMVHERFSNRDNANDVAILTMETCTDDFPVMELADSSFMKNLPVETGIETRVAGFGRTSVLDPSIPDFLQSVDVTYISRDDCDRDYYPSNQLKSDQFCAGSLKGGRDSCSGDSGSPLYIEDSVTGKQKQIGIVSWGVGCGNQATSAFVLQEASTPRQTDLRCVSTLAKRAVRWISEAAVEDWSVTTVTMFVRLHPETIR
ncbi:MAG: hypothetical protein SGARI_003696 [Bacillariaceae sp.]